jgi:hypothetical protein
LDTPKFRTAWADWSTYRAERRKPLAPSTVARQLRKLATYGHDGAITSIERSIEHGWEGLFRPKEIENHSIEQGNEVKDGRHMGSRISASNGKYRALSVHRASDARDGGR